MNCERFRQTWSDWREGWLHSEIDADAMARHRDGCAECARHDRQMRRLVDELHRLAIGRDPDLTLVIDVDPKSVVRWALDESDPNHPCIRSPSKG